MNGILAKTIPKLIIKFLQEWENLWLQIFSVFMGCTERVVQEVKSNKYTCDHMTDVINEKRAN